MDISHCLNREEDNLLIGIAILGLKGDILAQSLCLKAHIVVSHLAPFACLNIISGCIEHLSSRTACILTT